MLGSKQLESSFAEKVLPYQIVHEPAAMLSLVEKQVNGILGCIRQSIASRSREGILLLYLALLKTQLDYSVLFWVSPYKGHEQKREHPTICLEKAK